MTSLRTQKGCGARRGARAVVGGPKVPSALKIHIRRKLLTWYDRNRRPLPWRSRAADAYAQWVAEIMLQQTQVDTVVAYYERFLRRFPSVRALATADHAEVLRYWEGLGYYRRALHLHRAAKALHAQSLPVPSSVKGLRALPGVGEYTASAVASIAFNARTAAVDGNVARVLARLFGIEEDVTLAGGKRRVLELAEALLSVRRPGDFNQAWMDLGSLVCTPRSPKCGPCPLARVCHAARLGRVEAFPRRSASRRVAPRATELVVGVFVQGDKFLVRRRPEGGLWSGLWEFPATPLDGAIAPARLARRLAAEKHLGLCTRLRRVALVERQLTHRHVTFYVYVAEVKNDAVVNRGPSDRWVTRVKFKKLSVSSAHRQVYAAASAAVSRLHHG